MKLYMQGDFDLIETFNWNNHQLIIPLYNYSYDYEINFNIQKQQPPFFILYEKETKGLTLFWYIRYQGSLTNGNSPG